MRGTIVCIHDGCKKAEGFFWQKMCEWLFCLELKAEPLVLLGHIISKQKLAEVLCRRKEKTLQFLIHICIATGFRFLRKNLEDILFEGRRMLQHPVNRRSHGQPLSHNMTEEEFDVFL